MPNRQRDQQHRSQRAPRRRRYTSGGQGQTYKPGFPISLFTNSRIFYIIGAVVMIGGVGLAFILQSQGSGRGPGDADFTPAAEGTPVPSPTPDTRIFAAADGVTDPVAETYTATIGTAKGDITIELFVAEAPNTVNSFVFLAQKGFYDGLIFHRVVENFVAQGGDPSGVPDDGRDGPGYITADEPNEIRNESGTISMAKVSGQSVFGSQFFINLKDNPALDFDSSSPDRFYPFARVTDGMDVVLALVESDVINSVTIERTRDPNAPTPTATPDAETPPIEPGQFAQAEQVLDPAANRYTATIVTAKGSIVLQLFADVAPNTANSFAFLAQEGFFDGVIFHRVVADFVIQAGDPDPTDLPSPGGDGPGYFTQDEPNEFRNTVGRISMAKMEGETQFGSQFFINLANNAGLDFDAGRPSMFYPFGEVIEGLEVIFEIEQGDVIETITIDEIPR